MKKGILLAMSMAFAVAGFASCGHTHTFDATTWQSDANMHWRKATCEHTTEKYAVDVHTDANDDDKCDVCDYVMHTHTLDDLGNCTVCGDVVTAPDVSTVAKAIEFGVAQKSAVKSGTIDDGDYAIQYEFRNGYTFMKSNGTEVYYSKNAAGQVLGVISMWSSEMWAYETYLDTTATEASMNGAPVSTAFIGYMDEVEFYGVEGLVAGLYEIASENLNADFTETVDGDTYKFSFGIAIPAAFEWDENQMYVVETAFKLDAAKYYIKEVEITSSVYSGEQVAVKTEATDDAEATFEVVDGAEAWMTYEIVANQDETCANFANPYSADALLPTDFEVDAVIEVEQGFEKVVYITAVAPTTADMKFATVECSGDNVNLDEWGVGLSAYCYENGALQLTAYDEVGTEYTVVVNVNGVEKAITVKVVAPATSYVGVGTFVDEWGNITFEEQWDATMYTDGVYNLMVVVDKGETAVNVAIDNDATLGDATEQYVYNMELDAYYAQALSYEISGLAAGEYTITATCGDIVSTFTLTVEEKPAFEEIFENTWVYDVFVESTMWSEEYTRIEVAFDMSGYSYVDSEYRAAGGVVTITTTPVSYVWGDEYVDTDNAVSVTANFRYEEGAFVFMNNFGQTVDIGYALQITDVNSLQIGTVEVDWNDMNKGEAEEEIVLEPGQFMVQDNYSGALTGLYTYEIGANNAVTVYKDGVATTEITFGQNPAGQWGVSTLAMPMMQLLVDANGGNVTVLAGELSVNFVMDGIYVFTFPAV